MSKPQPRRSKVEEADEFPFEFKHKMVLRRFKIDPDEVTTRLQLKPTKVLRKGDPDALRKNRPAKINFWCRDTIFRGGTDAINASMHLRGLVRLIREAHARRRVIAKFIPPGEFYFYTCVYTNSPNHIVRLPLPAMRLLAEMNAEWYCSVWCTPRLKGLLKGDEN